MPLRHQDNNCPLCHGTAKLFWRDGHRNVDFYKCTNCQSIFKAKEVYLEQSAEKSRYQLHQNDIHDQSYQKFVSPITNAVAKDFSNNTLGLDYGCGSGPVISFVLEKKGYRFKLYDPYFYPSQDYLNYTYNFITCCEVMEHFYRPFEEFKHLKNLLVDNGKLYCKTNFISNSISVEEFSKWYYKDDPTHVFFYSTKALDFIKETFGFQDVFMSKKLITFSL